MPYNFELMFFAPYLVYEWVFVADRLDACAVMHSIMITITAIIGGIFHSSLAIKTFGT